jgi:hypothetical protein
VLTHQVSALEPTTLTLSAPARVTWTDAITFHMTASDNGALVTGLPIVLQSRATGSNTWRNRASTTTGAGGAADLTVNSSLTGNAEWRVISPADATRSAGRSANHLVQVSASFGTTPANENATAGRVVRFAITTHPYESNAMVMLQLRRARTARWTTKATSPITSSGRVSFAVTIAHPGSYTVRAIRAATPMIARTTGPAWSLHVD